MHAFRPGDVILGKYKVTGSLGKGGMGFVLSAENLGTGELVALKFLLPALRDDPEVSSRFDQEARTAIRINSQHVARVLDVATLDDGPFIVMEHLKGEDLAALLKRRGPLPVEEAIELLLQTCEAIHDMHLLGIVHRDLKPSNLFVTTSPLGRAFIKVLDFGISKSTTTDVTMTETRAVLGSPRYMSPEQLESPKSVDARADVWSLGVLLYEILSGVPPFPGDTYSVVSAAIRKGDYERLGSHRAGIAPELEEAVAGALKADRRERIASVEAFAAKLVPCGGDAARQSFERIQGRSAYALVEQAAASVTVADRAPEVDVAATFADAGTAPAVAESRAGTLAPRRWGRRVLAGTAVVAVGAAALVPRFLSPAARPEAAIAPTTVEPAPLNEVSTAPAPPRSGATPCAGGATPACEAACTAKAPESCYDLAHALAHGDGAAKDPARAARLYEIECTAGMALACNGAGSIYENGEGVARDYGRAVGLYKAACDGKVAAGCVNLGTMHFQGRGVPKNEELGGQYFLEGCDGHEPLGCLNVSLAYADGKGVPKDLGQSYAFAVLACDGGAAAGCVRVALAKVNGEGVAKDVNGGMAQLDALCKQGGALACETLTGLKYDGAGPRNGLQPRYGGRCNALHLRYNRRCNGVRTR
jgi:serine/threonine-protein kinase